MFNTEFTTEETAVLHDVLEHQIDVLDVEIDRTDTHDFKVKLRHRRDLLKSLMQKIGTQQTADVR